MGDSGRGDGGSAVMGGGGACVGSGMVGERDYCRIPEDPWGYLRALGRPPIQFPILFQIPSQ